MKRNIYILSVLALAISCTDVKDKDSKVQEEVFINQSFFKHIKTVKAELKTQEEELTLTGKVEYDPDKIVKYVPLINGVVTKTYFSLGDQVKQGQVLANVRSLEVNSLHSEKSSLQSELEVARRELKSAESMYKDNMLSESELIEARAKVKQAEAALGRVHTDMSVIGSNDRGTSSIVSQMSGYIINKNITSGSTISPDGEPIFTVADLSKVWVIANVYASNLQFVKVGIPVEMSSLSYPGEVFQGAIQSISQVFDSEEKVLKARIVMENSNLKFKPEMSMTIKLKNNTKNLKVSIPVNALIFDDDKYYVIVEESKEKFKIKEVWLQGHNEETAYILSGLSNGENVVIKNQLLIYSALKNK
jgi:membrane fusion protein, heavy metal efflux system